MTSIPEIFDEVPADLEAYFDRIKRGFYARRRDIGLNLLPVHQAADLTREFREFHPVIRTLDGFILDDPQTSDHHVYLGHPSLKGAVLYLAHDGDTRVVFASSDDFLAAADAAMDSGRDLIDRHPVISPIASDQERLSELIEQQLDADDGTAVITAIVPSMDLRDRAQDQDFFLGEAVAAEISKRPRADLREIAEICAAHRHIQAAQAGRRDKLAARGW